MEARGKIIRNYFYNFMYQTLVLIAPLITAPYLARVLGAEQLGVYSYVFSFTTIVTTLILMGIYSYGNRQMAYLRDDRKIMSKDFCEIMMARYILAGAGILVYLFVAILDKGYTRYFFCFFPYCLATLIDCSWIYVGVEDMRPTAMKNLWAKLASIILIFLFVNDTDDITVYLLILGSTTLISNIAVYFQLPKYVDYVKPNIHRFKKHIKEALRLFLPEAASLIYLQVDKIMLKVLSEGTQQVAYYDQAEKIVTIPMTFITVISTTVMPRLANEFANKNSKAIEKLLNRSGIVSLMMAFPMMLGLCAVSQNLIGWYLGSDFHMTANIIIILSSLVICNSLTGISGTQYFTATNQINTITKAYVLAAVSNVVINALLIPKFGCIGAAIATVISSYLSMLVQYRKFRKQIDIHPMIREGLKYAVISVVMFVAVITVSRFLNSGILKTLIQFGVGVLVYGIALLITRDANAYEALKIVNKMVRGRKNK